MKTTAKEIMSPDVKTATDGINIEDALKMLIQNQVTGLPVIDPKGRLLGVLSEFDIIEQLSQTKKLDIDFFQNPAQYSKDTMAVSESEPLEKIIDRFVKSRFRRLPVVDKSKKLVGIITRRDLMRLFYYRARLSV